MASVQQTRPSRDLLPAVKRKRAVDGAGQLGQVRSPSELAVPWGAPGLLACPLETLPPPRGNGHLPPPSRGWHGCLRCSQSRWQQLIPQSEDPGKRVQTARAPAFRSTSAPPPSAGTPGPMEWSRPWQRAGRQELHERAGRPGPCQCLRGWRRGHPLSPLQISQARAECSVYLVAYDQTRASPTHRAGRLIREESPGPSTVTPVDPGPPFAWQPSWDTLAHGSPAVPN